MTKRKVRSQAALICAVGASGGVYSPIMDNWTDHEDSVAWHLGIRSQKAVSLAADARYYVIDNTSWDRPNAWTFAEAEALLRTGWKP